MQEACVHVANHVLLHEFIHYMWQRLNTVHPAATTQLKTPAKLDCMNKWQEYCGATHFVSAAWVSSRKVHRARIR